MVCRSQPLEFAACWPHALINIPRRRAQMQLCWAQLLANSQQRKKHICQ